MGLPPTRLSHRHLRGEADLRTRLFHKSGVERMSVDDGAFFASYPRARQKKTFAAPGTWREPISYPESTGFLVSGRWSVETLG